MIWLLFFNYIGKLRMFMSISLYCWTRMCFSFAHCVLRLSYFVSKKLITKMLQKEIFTWKGIFVKKKGQPGAIKLVPWWGPMKDWCQCGFLLKAIFTSQMYDLPIAYEQFHSVYQGFIFFVEIKQNQIFSTETLSNIFFFRPL